MTSFQTEYEALTSGHGFIELQAWSTVTMTGADRQSFLHNMCTADIRSLSTGESCEAFCTNVQGKIVAHVFVIVREDRLELMTVPRQAETLIAHLDRYLIREEVTLADATEDFLWLFVGGSETASEISDVSVIRSGLGGLPGSVLGVASDQRELLLSQLNEACCEEAWEAIRIEASLPLFGIDFDNANLPQEVGRDAQAINFNKGCYLGQETIARIDALGHVNKKIVLLKFDGETPPPVGLELNTAGKSVGRVTSGCWSPHFQAPLALAMVRRGSNEQGTKLESNFGVAKVIALKGKEF